MQSWVLKVKEGGRRKSMLEWGTVSKAWIATPGFEGENEGTGAK